MHHTATTKQACFSVSITMIENDKSHKQKCHSINIQTHTHLQTHIQNITSTQTQTKPTHIKGMYSEAKAKIAHSPNKIKKPRSHPRSSFLSVFLLVFPSPIQPIPTQNIDCWPTRLSVETLTHSFTSHILSELSYSLTNQESTQPDSSSSTTDSFIRTNESMTERIKARNLIHSLVHSEQATLFEVQVLIPSP